MINQTNLKFLLAEKGIYNSEAIVGEIELDLKDTYFMKMINNKINYLDLDNVVESITEYKALLDIFISAHGFNWQQSTMSCYNLNKLLKNPDMKSYWIDIPNKIKENYNLPENKTEFNLTDLSYITESIGCPYIYPKELLPIT